MKPLRMRMQAFGPYAEVATVDFRNLLLGGLFLIHGPTGAGKTSILDGLCFSLFGRSSGSERSPENLRCDRAAPNLSTEVQLEFALGARVYRVIRRPRQIVKKQRGEGTTSTPAKGELFESLQPENSLEEMEWTLLASGEKKTDDRVTELLGMNEEQFRQVVVLPQGQFRKFLSSSSDEREELLETLFRTEQYRELTERLQARASLMAQEIGGKRQAVNSQLSLTGCENVSSLETTISDFASKLQIYLEGETQHESQFSEALKRQETARVFSRDLAELKNCSDRALELQKQKPDIDQIEGRLENERRSRPVLTLDSQVLSISTNIVELENQKKSETRALEQLRVSLDEKSKAKIALTGRKSEIEAMQIERSQLQAIYTDAKGLNQARVELSQSRSLLTNADKKFETETISLSKAKASKQTLQIEIDKRSATVHDLASARVFVEKLSARSQLLDRDLRAYEEVIRREQRADELLKVKESEFQNATVATNQLKLKFHLSQAAELASILKKDEECPVCGSVDHPKPAHLKVGSSGDVPSSELIEKADRELRVLGQEVSAARARLDAIIDESKKILASLSHTMGSTATESSQLNKNAVMDAQKETESLKQKMSELQSEIKRLETEERLLKDAKQTLDATEKQIHLFETTLESVRANRDETQKTFEKISEQISNLELRVPERYRDLETITKRGQSLRQEIESFTKANEKIDQDLGDAKEKVVRTSANIETFGTQIVGKTFQCERLTTELNAAIHSQNFANIEEARSASLTPELTRQLEQTKKVFENEWAANQARLEKLELELAKIPEWAKNLSQIESDYTRLELERRERINQIAELKAKMESLDAVLLRTKNIEAELLALEDRYKVLGKLSAVANGQPPHNVSRVNFQRYVLAARLDEVLDQASRRLFLMSRGQFILRRSKGADDKRKNAGLDLEVEDSFTGTCRPTSSLSGGEGFLASLSLALGLADVVQSRLGGVRLDAVFVDEGFGTLDGEALELAIKTLSELQAGGRIVGIISHVPELREQIAHRLHVRKTASGSSVGWENAST